MLKASKTNVFVVTMLTILSYGLFAFPRVAVAQTTSDSTSLPSTPNHQKPFNPGHEDGVASDSTPITTTMSAIASPTSNESENSGLGVHDGATPAIPDSILADAPLVACQDSGHQNWTTTSSIFQIIKECTVYVPNNGKVFISANASLSMYDTEYEAHFALGIDSTAGIYETDRYVDVYLEGGDDTDRTLSVSSLQEIGPGNHTFYLLGRRYSGSGIVLVYDPTLAVIYVPNNDSPVVACGTADGTFWEGTSNTFEVIRTCTMTVPENGKVLVSADGSLTLVDSDYIAHLRIGIDSTTGFSAADRYASIYPNNNDGTDTAIGLSLIHTIGPGTHTFYLLGRRSSDNTNTVGLIDATLTALYIPNSTNVATTCSILDDDIDWKSTSSDFDIIHQCDFTMPTDGWAYVTADGFMGQQEGKYQVHFRLGIDQPDGDSDFDRFVDSFSDAGTHVPGAVSVLKPLSAGQHTAYLVGRRASGSGVVRFNDPTLSVFASFEQPPCYQLTQAHTGSGQNPTVDPLNSDGCDTGQYIEGEEIDLDAQPGSGWQVTGWSGTNDDASTSESNTLTMPARNHTVGVIYEPICYRLTLGHTGNGIDPVPNPSNSPGCNTGEYHAGTTVNLTADADDGWVIDRWEGTNNDASTSSTNTLTMPARNHTVNVHYSAPCYRLTRTHTGDGGDPAASPAKSDSCATGEYVYNQNITLQANPAAGWKVAGWSGTNNDSGTSESNSLTMPANAHTVSVAYEPICYGLTLTHTGNGSNPVASPSQSTGCGFNQYFVGESITLNADPADDSEVERWSGTSNDNSTSESNSLIMPASNHTVTVHYRKRCYQLTRAHSGNGANPTASPSNSSGCNSGEYHQGATISLQADPDSGWEVERWSGTDNDVSNNKTNTITMPAADRIVRVYYIRSIQYVYLPVAFRGIPIPPFPELANGNFDAGDEGWSQFSSRELDLIVHENDIPADNQVHAHTPSWLAWLGGQSNESADLSQPLTIPEYYDNLKLHFYYWTGALETDCGDDMAWVRINDSDLWSKQLCAANETNGWRAVEAPLHLGNYAGQTVTLHFQIDLNGDNQNSNLFIDSVTLCDNNSTLYPCP